MAADVTIAASVIRAHARTFGSEYGRTESLEEQKLSQLHRKSAHISYMLMSARFIDESRGSESARHPCYDILELALMTRYVYVKAPLLV